MRLHDSYAQNLILWYNNAGDNMKKIFLILTAALLLTACKSEVSLSKHNEQILDAGFDTFIQRLAYTEDDETYEAYLKQVNETYQYYNKMFDRYHTYDGINNIKTINDQAGKAPVKVDSELIELLSETKKYSEISNGQYDVTFGAVLEIWHQYREAATSGGKAAIPSKKELDEAKKHTGWDKIEIDTKAQTVYINDPKASLDLGSAAKGYATELCAKQLETQGLKPAIINAGGNVRIIGNNPDADAWSVGIQLPSNEVSSSLATVKIDKNQSFVTSGDYQRAYEYKGKMYHHIIDPHTLMPATHMRSLTIVTKDSGIADILSTTLFTLSYEKGSKLLQQLKKEGIEAEAVWVFDDTTPLPDSVSYEKSGSYRLVISEGLKNQIEVKK